MIAHGYDKSIVVYALSADYCDYSELGELSGHSSIVTAI